jgi:hypothetical protein
MNMSDTQTGVSQQLASLLRDAGNAHHKAFIATNGDDPEWPIWYAEFLQPKVNTLLGTQWTKSELAYLLLRSEKKHKAQASGSSWPEFYARVFMTESTSP